VFLARALARALAAARLRLEDLGLTSKSHRVSKGENELPVH
jgi:hypothetical protein